MTEAALQGFVRTEGRRIVDGNGQPLLLRGVGLGNWMLPEGYMWKFSGTEGDRPRRIAARIEELIGKEKAVHFWEQFHERYITEADIRKIYEEGYNSIRLPINASFILEEGSDNGYIERSLQMIDRLIGWCRTYRQYVILDLHGAPGGQTGANIDDSPADHPDLFTDAGQRKRTIDLWVMLANRYKDERIVAGYDLLNEPLPDHFNQYWHLLVPLYKEIITEIRKVDPNHMIIIEGAHWATNFSMITEALDNNMLLQFHKYWNAPDTESIQRYLDKRDELNVPLYMGEGGENNPEWYAGAFQLFEDHDISWNFWPWKKLDTLNSPCSIRPPEHWGKIQAYVAGGVKPTPSDAETILSEYLDNILLENCDYRQDVVNSMLRKAPVRIAGIYYGYRGAGVSFSVTGHRSSDIELRQNDGVKIGFAHPSPDNIVDFANHGGSPRPDDTALCIELAAEEWTSYDINITELREHRIIINAAAAGESASVEISMDGELIRALDVADPYWKEITIAEQMMLTAGNHSIRVRVTVGTVKLLWIDVK